VDPGECAEQTAGMSTTTVPPDPRIPPFDALHGGTCAGTIGLNRLRPQGSHGKAGR
jgi:hypothetical protein